MKRGPGTFYNYITKQIEEKRKEIGANIRLKNLRKTNSDELELKNVRLNNEIEILEETLWRAERRSATPAAETTAATFQNNSPSPQAATSSSSLSPMLHGAGGSVGESCEEVMREAREAAVQLEAIVGKKYLNPDDYTKMTQDEANVDQEKEEQELEELQEEEQLINNSLPKKDNRPSDPRILELIESDKMWIFTGGKRKVVNRRSCGGVAMLSTSKTPESQITIRTSHGIYSYTRITPVYRQSTATYQCLRCILINRCRSFLKPPGPISYFVISIPCAEGEESAIEWRRDTHLEGCKPISESLVDGGSPRIPPMFSVGGWRTLLEGSSDHGRPDALRDTSVYMIVNAENDPVYIGKTNALGTRHRQHRQSGMLSAGGRMLVPVTGLTHDEALCVECVLHVGARDNLGFKLESGESTNIDDSEWLSGARDFGLELDVLGAELVNWITQPEETGLGGYQYECKEGDFLWDRFRAV